VKKRILLSALLVGALIGATSIVSGSAAAAGPAANAYQGTISLKRTCSDAGFLLRAKPVAGMRFRANKRVLAVIMRQ